MALKGIPLRTSTGGRSEGNRRGSGGVNLPISLGSSPIGIGGAGNRSGAGTQRKKRNPQGNSGTSSWDVNEHTYRKPGKGRSKRRGHQPNPFTEPIYEERKPIADIFYFGDCIELIFEIPNSDPNWSKEDIKVSIEDYMFELKVNGYVKKVGLRYPGKEVERTYNNGVFNIILKMAKEDGEETNYGKLLKEGYNIINIGEKDKVLLEKGCERIYYNLKEDEPVLRYCVGCSV